MARSRVAKLEEANPEEMLKKACSAGTVTLRAKYAQRGLAQAGALDSTTHAMLLRQLYLVHMEKREFDTAYELGERMVGLSVMPDVAHQDAARACLGLGEYRRAAQHLRLASRVGPASRRAFHFWTLGSLYYLRGFYPEAKSVLGRAARWGTRDKPLYRAQLALARLALDEEVTDLLELRDRLAESPCGQGYGQYVLGELAYTLGDFVEAEQHLLKFIQRCSGGRAALQVALAAELRRAQGLVDDIRTASKEAG